MKPFACAILSSLTLLFVATGCPKPTTLSVAPQSDTVFAGDPPVTFTATFSGGTGVAWTLSPSVGTLSATTGASVTYTPPASVATLTEVQLVATLQGGSTTATALIVVQARPVGALAVSITTPGGTPNVTVSGPGGYSQALSSSAVLSGLDAGTYSVSAQPLTLHDTYVEQLLQPTVSSPTVNVAAGGTSAVTVTYSEQGGTGRMWVAEFDPYGNGALAAFVPTTELNNVELGDEQLFVIVPDAGSDPVLAVTPRFLAFDAQLNLWVGDRTGHRILRFDSSELSSPGPIAPTAVLQDPSDGGPQFLLDPHGMAFDRSGALWVAVETADSVARYSNVATLQGTQQVTPDAVLTNPADGGLTFSNPFDLAFDRTGTLWVLSFSASQASLYGSATGFWNPSQFQGDVGVTPDLWLIDSMTIAPSQLFFAFPEALAFDSSDNLWLVNTANYPFSTVVAVPPSQWKDGGVMIPSIALHTDDAGIVNPTLIAFDPSDNLWVSSQVGQVLLEFPNPLSLSGEVYPDAGVFPIVTGGFGRSLGSIAFDPPPAALPLIQ